MAVCASAPLAPDAIPALLARLEAASLILDETSKGGPDGPRRYAMLESIRQYGHELLEADSGAEAAITRGQHWDWCTTLADQAVAAFVDGQQTTSLDLLEREHDNLRAALAWSLTDIGSSREGLRLAAALWRFWYVRGHFREGRDWLERLLARAAPPAATPSSPAVGRQAEAGGRPQDSARARALTGAGSLAFIQGDLVRARALQEECLALYRTYGNTLGIAATLHNLADVLYRLGDLAQSVALHEEALVLQRRLGRKDVLAAFLNSLGNALLHQGNYTRAEPLFEESLALCRDLDHAWGSTIVLRNLGLLALAQGHIDRAAASFEESLALSQRIGSAQDTVVALNDLGAVAAARGEYDRAAALHAESFELAQTLGDRWSIATIVQHQADLALRRGDFAQAATRFRESLAQAADLGSKEGICENLEGLARVYALQGHAPEAEREAHSLAARLFGTAAALRESSGAPLTPVARRDYEYALARVRAVLGEATLATLLAEGAAMPPPAWGV
jgi:tetratricopeptide (TPR) repeat protein